MAAQDQTQHPLKLYNSLTREVEQFVPRAGTPTPDNPVTMYNCGPTVYSYAHIGNARAAVVADVLFRVLRHIYGEDSVRYARNITDVDDKIIAAAKEQAKKEGREVPISEITEKYARIYNEDLDALNCLRPTVQPKATEHIQQMADIIVALLDKEVAYEADGHVYFDVMKKNETGELSKYGALSGRKLEDNLAGARVEVAAVKRNPGDFVLWKPAKDGEPGWSQQESSEAYKVDWRNHANKPFANVQGRPGWHIECSAMAKAELGETIDIHCGGIDLKFPHHENEIAQSETANEQPFANFWVHNEFLNMGKDKMSKSLGNIVLVHDLLKKWDGEVIRLALMKADYRSELVWSEDLLRESKANLDEWYRSLLKVNGLRKHLGDARINYSAKSKFFNDLDVLSLLGHLSEQVSTMRAFILSNDELDRDDGSSNFGSLVNYHDGKVSSALDQVTLVSNLLGLLQRDPDDWFAGNASDDDKAKFDALAKARAAARAVKDWAEADRIRDEGAALGIVFEDGKDGTSWRKA